MTGAAISHDLAIEWPAVLPHGWTDGTRIAATADGTRSALVVAPTLHADGGPRVDLLPKPGGGPGYTRGYNGGGPLTVQKVP